ncbi:MAG TPA: cell wall-binding repeat-containing protein [Acidimicrobiales bacterium]|nr:cell wall-binding repeat-containing protein [Acidimicrobiales bacterium]
MRRALPPVLVALLLLLGAPAVFAQESDDADDVDDDAVVHDIVFPVVGDVSYSDTFGAPRGGGSRSHEGQDLLGEKMQELVATVDGTIELITWPEASYGHYLRLVGDDGWTYNYVHINNDTPGTDDGEAERDDVYGPGIDEGVRVERGQLLAYLGDSGNAEETAPHLHFEMKDPDGAIVNPYASLRAAQQVDAPVAEAEPSPIPRLAGVDRVETAVAVSERGWPDGADGVVLAAGDAYAEALPASVLAAERDEPLLLTTGDDLPEAVADELDRLEADEVTVIGSVPEAVDDALADAGYDVERLGAPGDPVGTAVAVAGEIGGEGGTVVLVNRTRFADGISAAALAGGRGWPILLTEASLVPQPTVDAWRMLGSTRVVLVGGTGVIGDNIADFVEERGRCAGSSGCELDRLAGVDRYATSVEAAEASIELGGRSSDTLLLGTGVNYPDTLASGPLTARLGGVALLVDGTGRGNDDASRDFLVDQRDDVDDVTILGGPGAVTGAADRAIQEALGIDRDA